MNLISAPLGSILNCSVYTLKEYLKIKGIALESNLNITRNNEIIDNDKNKLNEFLNTILIFEDPLISDELLLVLKLLRNDINMLNVNKDLLIKDKSINMHRILTLSSIIVFNYSNSYKNHCLCIGKRFNMLSRKNLKEISNIDINVTNVLENNIENKYELIMCNYFPKIKRSLLIRSTNHSLSLNKNDMGFDFNYEIFNTIEDNHICNYNISSTGLSRLQNIENWEKLLNIIGPIEMTVLFISCTIFKRLSDKSNGFIQQSGRMITNDYLDKLNVALKTETSNKKSKYFSNNNTNELKISNLYRIDIPIHSNILYCDHFSRRGGLPCTSILRLLPPTRLGSRTLLRFIFHSEYLFKDHDKNSMLNILGSYNMNKYSRVRCKLASEFLIQYEKLLINIRKIDFISILSKLCPLCKINNDELVNLNKMPLYLFETKVKNVVKYVRLILTMALPKNIFGSSFNLKKFLNKKIPILINLHSRENYKIRHIMNGIKISSWVNSIMCENEYKNKKNRNNNNVNRKRRKSHLMLSRNYIARNFYFIIVHLVNPILRRHFYITDSEGSNRIRYFRYPIWIKIVRQAEKNYLCCILRDSKLNNNSDKNYISHDYNEDIIDFIDNIPKIRWLPKSKGVRPLLNLSKIGSGKIIYNKYMENHEYKNLTYNGKCLCSLTWLLNGNSPIQSNTINFNSNLFCGFSCGDNNNNCNVNLKTKPSSGKVIDLKRPSTNNLLFYLSKILRSFLLSDINNKLINASGGNYLGTSIVRYVDIYKCIKKWWFYMLKKTIFQRMREYVRFIKDNDIKKARLHFLNKYKLNKVYIIKADMDNCYENIEKRVILDLLEKIKLPEKIIMLTSYNRMLRKTTLTPPFNKLFKVRYIDEKNRSNIVISKGKLNILPILNFINKGESERKNKTEEEFSNDVILKELENISNHRSEISMMGNKNVDLFTSLNSKRTVIWEEAKKLVKLYLENNYIRMRTTDKIFKKNRINKLKKIEFKNNIKINKKLYCNIIKQENGIPQGSVISYILCCLYYGFLDNDSNIRKLLLNNSDSSFSNKNIDSLLLEKDDSLISVKKRKIERSNLEIINSIENEFMKDTDKENICSINDNVRNYNLNISNIQGFNDKDNIIMNDNNLLLRWVDDFLFLTIDLESARNFLNYLYIKKLWGNNISREKINSNFKWYVDGDNIRIIDEEDDFYTNKDFSKKDNEKVLLANKFYREKVNWLGITFCSHLFNINFGILPWKNVEFNTIMDTITLTMNDHYFNCNINQKQHKIQLSNSYFGKNNYMWSILGIKVHSYFDLRIKNRLLFDSKINSISTVSLTLN
ncbi:telomerase reverse transcriptase [Cryptosporidium ryanae]|uniref:telomerase reverse transcriptase n=1 Tax=Cryptosporidium ryanae TaxID=515981 RepID=UPI00351A571B|nr:telomerase reverse transcriptase [Cryptosporidium ryanae]